MARKDNKVILQKLHEIITTIYRLQSENSQEWLTWGAVAKTQEGSAEFAVMLSGFAQLPMAQDFLITMHGAVKLTEAGAALARWLLANPPPKSQTQEIAAAVRRYASGIHASSYPVLAIGGAARVDRRYVQAIAIEIGDDIVATNTPVAIRRADSSTATYGVVVGQDNDQGVLYLALNSEITSADLPCRLRVDRAFLLSQLATALEELPAFPERAKAILDPADSRLPITNEDSGAIADMLQGLRPPWTRFLWGPPGAGKTYALGRLMLNLLRRDANCRILLVAPSNFAADVALAQFVGQLEQSDLRSLLAEHRILRYGYPRKAELLARSELLGSAAQREKARAIERLADEIRRDAEKKVDEQRLAVKRAQLLALQEELKQLVSEHIGQCRVVATTTTLAYMQASPITQQKWDTVLVDEVTMVPPAMCVYLSALAESRVLFAGDPRQLGPVFQEHRSNSQESTRWMGHDIYDVSGIAQGEGEQRQISVKDTRLTRITRQRRCAPPIWAKVEKLYTDVQCRVDEQSLQHLYALPPLPGKSVVLVDVSDAAALAQCTQAGGSWQNEYTATLAMRLLHTLLTQAHATNAAIDIAVIAPYRAQIKQIRQKLHDVQEEIDFHNSTVEAGTIHQFQGSEADVVIFDMVDGAGRPGLGKLLKGDTGLRLVNVAITRARGKVILLVNRTWCRTHLQRVDNALLWQIIFHTPSTEIVPSLAAAPLSATE
jgi:hypothetical protein